MTVVPKGRGATAVRTLRTWVRYSTAIVVLTAFGIGAGSSNADASLKPPMHSGKWAGYAATGATFTSVTGTWTVPSVQCGPNDGRSTVIWVGLDGANAGATTVEQAGTGISCNADGSVNNFAWTETFPSLWTALDPNAYPVRAGDTITSTVSVGLLFVFSMTLTDRRAGVVAWTHTTSIITLGASGASAEWVVEAPSRDLQSPDLAIMAMDVTFTDMSTTTGAVAGLVGGVAGGLTGNRFDWRLINLVQGAVQETPSALSAGGTSFAVIASAVVANSTGTQPAPPATVTNSPVAVASDPSPPASWLGQLQVPGRLPSPRLLTPPTPRTTS